MSIEVVVKHIFVSYSSKNTDIVTRLATDLTQAGLELDLWIDRNNLVAGQNWQAVLLETIKNVDAILVCLSTNSIISKNVRLELVTAQANDIPIIPFMVEDCLDLIDNFEEIRFLKDRHIISYQRYGDYQGAFNHLLYSLDQFKKNQGLIRNPYKGLSSFQQADADIFFGREELVNLLLEKIKSGLRLIAVIGNSGSGKSSVVRAGLLPALGLNAIDGSKNWPLATFTPNTNPRESLIKALLPILNQDQRDIRKHLSFDNENPARNLDALDALVEQIVSGNSGRLVLVIDQFEEIFTRRSSKDFSETKHFIDLLIYAVSKLGGNTQVIITFRADFYGSFSVFPELAKLIQANNILITDMQRDEIRQSISEPARVVGLDFEPGLVDTILEDTDTSYSLPLLQYALQLLVDKRNPISNQITLETYRRIGGVKNALAAYAEEFYEGLSLHEKTITREILLRLVTYTGKNTKQTHRLQIQYEILIERLSQYPRPDIETVIEKLIAARLITSSREYLEDTKGQINTETWLSIGHEALLTTWKSFEDWQKSFMKDIEPIRQLEFEWKRWQDSGQSEKRLLDSQEEIDKYLSLPSIAGYPELKGFLYKSQDYLKKLEIEQQETQARKEAELRKQRRSQLRYTSLSSLILFLAIALGAGVALPSILESLNPAPIAATTNTPENLISATAIDNPELTEVVGLNLTKPEALLVFPDTNLPLNDWFVLRLARVRNDGFTWDFDNYVQPIFGLVRWIDTEPRQIIKSELLANGDVVATILNPQTEQIEFLWNIGDITTIGSSAYSLNMRITDVYGITVISPPAAGLIQVDIPEGTRITLVSPNPRDNALQSCRIIDITSDLCTRQTVQLFALILAIIFLVALAIYFRITSTGQRIVAAVAHGTSLAVQRIATALYSENRSNEDANNYARPATNIEYGGSVFSSVDQDSDVQALSTGTGLKKPLAFLEITNGVNAILGGNQLGRHFSLRNINTVLGRYAELGVDLEFHFDNSSSTVSGRHCNIEYSLIDAAYFIYDLNSTNGTKINGQPVIANEKVRLNDGDILELGNKNSFGAEFRFHLTQPIGFEIPQYFRNSSERKTRYKTMLVDVLEQKSYGLKVELIESDIASIPIDEPEVDQPDKSWMNQLRDIDETTDSKTPKDDWLD
jgi:pSer/pThr/pTyr-binding forkhead associated (FHA) protein